MTNCWRAITCPLSTKGSEPWPKGKVDGDFLSGMLCFCLGNSLLQSITLHQVGRLRTMPFVYRNLYCRQENAVGIDCCSKPQVVNVFEEMLIIDIESTISCIQILDPYILEIVLNLISMRIQATVWRNDTVTVEVVVAGWITSIVTTIGKDFLAGDRALVANTLVSKSRYNHPDTLILANPIRSP